MIKPIDAIRNELPVVTSKTLDLFESAVSQELQKETQKPHSKLASLGWRYWAFWWQQG
ncbi:hypothetical protein KIH21_04730 [Lacticaseibacillus paracasei subsp. paracasei]|nr:hypothetical protein LCA32G_1014 [Lacticaseibacillus paracasei]QWA32632.1 hypothetical protein KIH21_04730 [Lacticaseibacillus paracasei subsp. paracasei]